MAIGAKSLEYKDALNLLEESQPGLKSRFLTGFLRRGKEAVGASEPVTIRECAECGQPTTAEVCAYCRMRKRKQRQVAARDLS
jgi:recombinational DNA repair protein RecR